MTYTDKERWSPSYTVHSVTVYTVYKLKADARTVTLTLLTLFFEKEAWRSEVEMQGIDHFCD